MTTLTAPIVGMHFRPPAKAIIAVLPVEHPLVLTPEPENPYDEHAVKVSIRTEALRELCEGDVQYEENLSLLLHGFGQSVEEIVGEEAPEEWHLGYIESSKTKSAERFAKAMAGVAHEAKLGFDMVGKPTAVLEVEG